ncbi:single-stranded DNA-binding protein [Microbacterium sp. USHLN186]|uniref:single-stranded DNA-binding protein n=1 Tax=Microbacterium sp. USHLN186 TaxID=3081286 RepID=UPI003018FBDC
MTLIHDTVTIAGNIGNDPTFRTMPSGVPVLNFRVGSSSGYRDRRTGEWVEGQTSWYAVSAFRDLAEHGRASLRCGDPVIITGTLKVKEWENDVRKGVSVDIVADAIGHDLNRGTSAFVRRPKGSTASAPAAATADVSSAGTFSAGPFAPAAPADDGPALDEVPADMRDAWGRHGLIDTTAGEEAAEEPLDETTFA